MPQSNTAPDASTQEPQEPVSEAPEPTEGQQSTEPTEGAQEDAQQPEEKPAAGPGSDAWKDVPDFAQREVSDLRKEAAQRRQQVKDLNEQLANAKSQEDIDTAVREYSEKVSALEAELTRTRAGAGLSEDSQAILANVPVDQVEATAARLRALEAAKQPAPPAPDPNLGDPLNAGPQTDPKDETDGGEAMRAWRAANL